MILQRVTPIVALLRRCGPPCDTVSAGLMNAMRTMTGGLAARLSVATNDTMVR